MGFKAELQLCSASPMVSHPRGWDGKSQGWPHLSQATAKSSSCIKTSWDMVWAFRTAKHCVKKGRSSLELILCCLLWEQACIHVSQEPQVPVSRAAAQPVPPFGHPRRSTLHLSLLNLMGSLSAHSLSLSRFLWVSVLPSQGQTAAPSLASPAKQCTCTPPSSLDCWY